MQRTPPWRSVPALAICLALLFPVIAQSRAAHAAEGSGWSEDDTITAQVQDGQPRAVCRWRVVTGVDPASGSVREQPVQRHIHGETETLYQRDCAGQASWYQWIRNSTTQRITERAKARASDKLLQLVFSTAPPRDRVVVNVGTWFWVPRILWKPVSATAYITTTTGVISVTVTATPSRLKFDPGNGDDTVWCDGPGDPWRPSYGDNTRSDCMYTYRHSSDDVGRFKGHTGVQWKLKVTSNFGLSFPLPNVTLSLPTSVTVRELQAVLLP